MGPSLGLLALLPRLLLAVAILPATATTDEQAAIQWMHQHAIPLATVEAGHGFTDLEPLDKVVGDARIVELGEATHGTREFFQLKHRLIEFLASKKGFTIFSIEADMPEAYRLNDFVLNGRGDPKELIKGMEFWTWQTDEVLDMVLWMREFNKQGKGRIEFTGFDMQNPKPSIDIVNQFVRRYDAGYAPTLDAAYKEVNATSGNELGLGVADFPVSVAAGHHIVYSGYAGLWWRVDGQQGSAPLAFDNMQDRGASGTTPWTRYEIALNVPKNAQHINFGALHPGDGTAWFDSLQVEIDGVPYQNTSSLDLDFESPSAVGFRLHGENDAVEIDAEVSHTGRQSLRSRYLKPKPVAEQDCQAVVDHLEANRSMLIAAKALEKDVDWAIQNARLVLEYSQLENGAKTRDESMAQNVVWIADHNPGAKLVIWAHNAHVLYGEDGPATMGSYLHKKFGSEIINFGFAFNQGSFQAIEINKGLRAFTLAPAPDGTLDQALSAVGLPLFALDLRPIPREGPVARWFSQPHRTRSIGSGYSESIAPALWYPALAHEAYDVVLFVEKTTAAHPMK